MYNGDRVPQAEIVRRITASACPRALDNRPMTVQRMSTKPNGHQVIFVSATPGDWEIEHAGGVVVEQVIRPTGLLDPRAHVRPTKHQVDDLLSEIRARVARNERVLITTLTKRMAEDLTEYYSELGVSVRYLHSDVDTLERVEILRDLRRGEFDVLVGINLLREGLDLPEVSLVGILDADKEGFLRSARSLIQTMGRAARNAGGEVIMYADRITNSMQRAIEETDRRRARQIEYNEEHGITPQTVKKAVLEMDPSTGAGDYVVIPILRPGEEPSDPADVPARIEELKSEMLLAAEELEFEKAVKLRDRIEQLRATLEPGKSDRNKRDPRAQRPRR